MYAVCVMDTFIVVNGLPSLTEPSLTLWLNCMKPLCDLKAVPRSADSYYRSYSERGVRNVAPDLRFLGIFGSKLPRSTKFGTNVANTILFQFLMVAEIGSHFAYHDLQPFRGAPISAPIRN